MTPGRLRQPFPADPIRWSCLAGDLVVGHRVLVDGSDNFATIISIERQPSTQRKMGRLHIAVAPMHPDDMAGPQMLDLHQFASVIAMKMRL